MNTLTGQTQGNKTPSKFDVRAATYLYECLVARNLVKGHPNVQTAWADEFRRLRARVDKCTLKQVLLWYCANIRGPGVAWAYTARTFRQKFESIQEAMRIATECEAAAVVVSNETAGLAYWHLGPWPNKTQADAELAWLQVGLDNFALWIKAWQDVSAKAWPTDQCPDLPLNADDVTVLRTIDLALGDFENPVLQHAQAIQAQAWRWHAGNPDKPLNLWRQRWHPRHRLWWGLLLGIATAALDGDYDYAPIALNNIYDLVDTAVRKQGVLLV